MLVMNRWRQIVNRLSVSIKMNKKWNGMFTRVWAETSTPNESQSNSSEQTEHTEQVPDQVPANKPPASAD